MVRAADVPPPRGTLSLRPTERLPQLREQIGWGLGLRVRRWTMTNRIMRRRILAAVHTARGRYDQTTDAGIVLAANDLRGRLRQGRLTPRLMADAMGLIDEALFRTRGFRFHDTQLRAGIALSAGYFVEMATGEGKTLTGTLPVAMHALAGCACHVVTVNDYLAERDAEEAAPLLERLGLSTACVLHDMKPEEKRAAYLADVTYCANKELVFDYLRDRAKLAQASPLAYRLQLSGIGSEFAGASGPVVQDLDFVVIDEADSVLIDEANIPLILTEPQPDSLSEDFLRQAIYLAEIAGDEVWQSADQLGYRTLKTDRLHALIQRLPQAAPEWKSFALAEELLIQAKTAQDRYVRDVNYIIEEEKLVLVDPQTGRPTPDRSLPWGLQQVIEIREGLKPSATRRTIGKLSFQSYFRKYHKMCGMSGTLREVRRELTKTYNVPVVAVPTNRPVIRFQAERHLFETTDEKIEWAVSRARQLAADGRAILIGVSSVALSEQVSAALRSHGMAHGVLNARRLAEEAEVVAGAGQAAIINVVTNMAGRGTDIKLSHSVRGAGGLHVIILDALETDRLDRQLYGRAGRQGDPGSFDICHSLDEPELARLMKARSLRWIGRLFSVYRAAGTRVYFAVLARRRRYLEGVRRDRRLKLLNSEEKRNDVLVFTRRV
ncbi:preprotein translocase subunit SecA [Pseudogemmobacter sp. W21_MBD1_M6]|uniref:preprotein translocase subunit SecA n=1 Tax=Pseudogemmobacter sp. W21_MBD1_M6 TaxID=3240271 RepID=UPI003F9D69C9